MKKTIITSLLLCLAVGGALFSLKDNELVKKVDAAGGYTIELDTTYLNSAVVSNIPIDLKYHVVDSTNNYDFSKSAIFTVTTGADVASIIDNEQVLINKPGNFSIMATVKESPSQTVTFNFVAYKLDFSNVRILSPLENLTVYSQAIPLRGRVDVDCSDPEWWPEDVHDDVAFEVVSGPAYLTAGDYLHFSDAGEVQLKCYSIYDKSVSKTVNLTVSNPDLGKDFIKGEPTIGEKIYNALNKVYTYTQNPLIGVILFFWKPFLF